jgi:hypothetical protein
MEAVFPVQNFDKGIKRIANNDSFLDKKRERIVNFVRCLLLPLPVGEGEGSS